MFEVILVTILLYIYWSLCVVEAIFVTISLLTLVPCVWVNLFYLQYCYLHWSLCVVEAILLTISLLTLVPVCKSVYFTYNIATYTGHCVWLRLLYLQYRYIRWSLCEGESILFTISLLTLVPVCGSGYFTYNITTYIGSCVWFRLFYLQYHYLHWFLCVVQSILLTISLLTLVPV